MVDFAWFSRFKIRLQRERSPARINALFRPETANKAGIGARSALVAAVTQDQGVVAVAHGLGGFISQLVHAGVEGSTIATGG